MRIVEFSSVITEENDNKINPYPDAIWKLKMEPETDTYIYSHEINTLNTLYFRLSVSKIVVDIFGFDFREL